MRGHQTKLTIRVIPSAKSRYEHWRGFFPLLLKNRALLSKNREQREAGLRNQIWNIAPSPLPSFMVIQAHVKKAIHRAATTVINQKQALASGEPALSSRAGRPLCNSHGKLLPPEAGGREFPCLMSAQLRHISRVPRHSGATARPKVGLEDRAPQDRWHHPALGSGLHIKGVAGAV